MKRDEAVPGTLYVNWQTGDADVGVAHGCDGSKTLALEVWDDDLTPVKLSSFHRRGCDAVEVTP